MSYFIISNHNNNIAHSLPSEIRQKFRVSSLSKSYFKIDYNIPYLTLQSELVNTYRVRRLDWLFVYILETRGRKSIT